jgi:bifunctional non-homologous end joining protein LigD
MKHLGDMKVEISNPDKVLFPDDGLTKRDLVDYYSKIADVALPHFSGRPVTQHRFPDGIGGEGFYQKEIPDYFPDWIARVTVEKKEGGSITHLLCENRPTMEYLANQACITPHVWLSRVDRPDSPDRLIFDLDPPDDDFLPVKKAAGWLKDLLDEIEMPSFPMTTGSRGIHIVVPLDRSADFDTVRSFARKLSVVVERRYPEDLTTEQRKAERRGRIFIDIMRNAYAQTTPVPYAVRAKPGAPVATPLDWEDFSDARLVSTRYHIGNVFKRLAQKTDPWKSISRRGRSLNEPRRRLASLTEKS